MAARSCSILLKNERSILPILFQASAAFSTFPPDDLKRLDHKDWLSPKEVLKIFNGLRDPESVIPVLDSVSKRNDFKPSEALYTLVINKLARASMFDAIQDVMTRLKVEKHCRLSDVFFYNLIKVYGNVAGWPDRAVETLFDMPKFHCWPSVKTFNLVLNMLVSAKRFDVVHKVYAVAPELGVEIDACCLNILVKGLCKSGKVDTARQLLDEYPKQKCRPNVRTFSTLMHWLCESGRVEEAMGLLERMEREGIYPDTVVFNILISGLRKRGRMEEGMELLERMKLKGCYPNAGSYQEVLYGVLDAGRLGKAKECVCRMLEEGASPSYLSYKMMIHGFCKEKQVGDVVWSLEQMVEHGFVPEKWMWRRILQTMFPAEVGV